MPDTKFWLSVVGLVGLYTIAYWTWHAVKDALQARRERKALERIVRRAARDAQRDYMMRQEEDAHYAGVTRNLFAYAESLFSERK